MFEQTPVPTFPRLVALCGHPKSGKSEVQLTLNKVFGYQPVDDGFALRKFAVESLGLSWDDVQSQAGKARSTQILGLEWINREILGEFGNRLEVMFGEHIMPFMATRHLNPNQLYSFGSVRKTQGAFYKDLGGVVIGVRRPGVGPSGYAFDLFDESLVDHWIDNDGTLDDLRMKAAGLLGKISAKNLIGAITSA